LYPLSGGIDYFGGKREPSFSKKKKGFAGKDFEYLWNGYKNLAFHDTGRYIIKVRGAFEQKHFNQIGS